MRRKNKHTAGFTLVELLTVALIIGLLSTLLFVSINAARSKARDAVRKQNLVQIKKALELYYDDHGAYPLSSGGWYAFEYQHPIDYILGITPTYLARLPNDPLVGKIEGLPEAGYKYISDGKDYKIVAYGTIEKYSWPTLVPSTDPFHDLGHVYSSYALYTSGAVNW
ncbi:MAG: type II secretion system protein [bacterium]|nr:type II secretion system protein [bacterium]